MLTAGSFVLFYSRLGGFETEYRVIRTDDELMHKKQHKYIDKIRMKNGKYRYIYDKLGFDERDAYRKAEKDLDTAKNRLSNANNQFININNDAVDILNKHQYLNGKAPKNGYHPLSSMHKHLRQQRDRYYDTEVLGARKNSERAEWNHNQTKRAYEKTPLYKLEKVANTGKKYLDKLFKK